MKWMKRIVMRRAMLRSGAVLMTCSHCNKKTPVYLKDKECGAYSSICLHCEDLIQVRGESEPVTSKIPMMSSLMGTIEIS